MPGVTGLCNGDLFDVTSGERRFAPRPSSARGHGFEPCALILFCGGEAADSLVLWGLMSVLRCRCVADILETKTQTVDMKYCSLLTL